MSNDRFASILDRPATSIERPKPIPAGTYRCIVKGLPRYDKSAKKQTDFIEFTLAPQSALDDVDEDALKAYLGDSKVLADTTIRATYYITEDSVWRLKKFLEDLGFDVEDDSHSLRDLCESAQNSEVYATVKHRPSQDGKSIFAELNDTARVE